MLKPKIKVRLAELELTQVDIFEEFSVGKMTFSNWVTGKSRPNLEQAFKLAKRLDCKVDELWEYREE
ncbi:helix-turn-helix transcriptional regulator [Alkalihalobacillus sp. 1P02AB]|uniref:helix-turn-helix transcriptional regulator n=1 Tax=Alkalihalobacillus sp. 1P02AB TaxID=3132260 RepID=UPI0039A77CB7